MRKLVTIRKISEILPIEGADRIELARVDGWQCVVKKGEFKVGDSALYHEIDSLLPLSEDRYAFLRNPNKPDAQKHRLKTIKLKGQVSQGLLLPLIDLPIDIPEDLDALLGVEKYEPEIPASLQGLCRGSFPSFIPKTDEERVQNIPERELLGKVYEVTEKLDGSSMTVYLNEGEFGVCSRNINLTETEGNTYWKVARKLDLEIKLRDHGKNIALQGELCGPGIQGNKYKLIEHMMYLFRVWNIETGRFLNSRERKLLSEVFEIPHVPIIEEHLNLEEMFPTDAFYRDFLLVWAEDKSCLNNKTEREGLVFKSVEGNFSFKAISNRFLLKEG